jgi:predicted dienelactone hydrolase
MTPSKPDATSSAIADYSVRGPYDVGMMTLTLADNRPVDVWYPAAEGAATGVERFMHNLNDPWPDALRAKLPPSEDIVVDAYEDIAASSDGPFPVILESHGFGSSRRDGANNHSHLASWGFFVIAPEHFERNRATVIGRPVKFETLDDATVLGGALELAQEESATAGSPLEGAVDATRVAVDGISAGGRAALEFGADARIDAVIGRAPAGPDAFDPPLQVPVLIIASDNDSLVKLPRVEAIYQQLSPPRRLAVILKGGHNTFSDSCAQIWANGGLDIAALSEATGFPPALLEAANNGCSEAFTDPKLVWPLISHLQVAHVRAALGLDPDDSALEPGYIAARFPGLLAEYRSDE